jgi:hypothetical protein
MPDLTDEEIRSRIRDAFKPYRCALNDLDHGGGVKFAVFHGSEKLVEMRDVPFSRIRTRRNLTAFIENAVDLVRKRAKELKAKKP